MKLAKDMSFKDLYLKISIVFLQKNNIICCKLQLQRGVDGQAGSLEHVKSTSLFWIENEPNTESGPHGFSAKTTLLASVLRRT